MTHTVNELQKCLLNMVRDFHDICVNNKLDYYIIGGTFLGAVRHKGFIPWDDDIDIGMPRNSYEKFLKLPDSALPGYLSRLNAGYGNKKRDFLYVKLCNKNTTLVENGNEKRVEGVYIDIFPLDGAHNTRIGSYLKYYISRIYTYGIWLNGSDKERDTLFKRLAQKCSKAIDNEYLYNRGNEYLAKAQYDQSKYVGNYLGRWGPKEIMSRNIFGRPTLYEFEEIMLYGPENAHEYLSTVYGSYMKLPPLEKRKSNHAFEYVNLQLRYEKYHKEQH